MKKKYEEEIELIRRFALKLETQSEKLREDLAYEFETMSMGDLIGAEGMKNAQAYSAIAIAHDCISEAVKILYKLQKGDKKQ